MGKTPKIPRNLSDKEMFKGWQEDLTIEERVTRLERRVALLEMKDGAVG